MKWNKNLRGNTLDEITDNTDSRTAAETFSENKKYDNTNQKDLLYKNNLLKNL